MVVTKHDVVVVAKHDVMVALKHDVVVVQCWRSVLVFSERMPRDATRAARLRGQERHEGRGTTRGTKRL
jgi:hypothetical protein